MLLTVEWTIVLQHVAFRHAVVSVMDCVLVVVPIVPDIALLIVMTMIAEKNAPVGFAVPHVAPIVIYLVARHVNTAVRRMIVKQLVMPNATDVTVVKATVNRIVGVVAIIIVIITVTLIVLVPPHRCELYND